MSVTKPKIEDFTENDSYSMVKKITVEDVDHFIQISGDSNALHRDEIFAQARGFKGRVVHGALLISYISQLIGVHFPGEGCLLQSFNIKFLSPCYIDDTVEFKARVVQVSTAVNLMVLDISVENVKTKAKLVKADTGIILLKVPA